MDSQVLKLNQTPSGAETYAAHSDDVRTLLDRRRQLRAELADLERRLLKASLGEQMLG